MRTLSRVQPTRGSRAWFALLAVALAGSGFASSVARADEALAKQHNCVMCHDIETKYVGPAFRDVARKYKGQPDAAAMLANKVKKGGGGVWGAASMPANKTVPSGDINKLVDWVLRSD